MDSETFDLRTGTSETVLDITRQCADFVEGKGDGLLHVFVPHATAGIAILETGAGWTTTCSPPSPTCCRPTTGGGTATARRDTGART